MDFTKIRSIGLFPLFPGGDSVEDQEVAEALINAINGEVQTRQAQWRTLSYRDLLSTIQQSNLGTGYKNLQADYNTFAGPAGQVVLSPQTKTFLKELARVTGADAFLIGSYSLSNEVRQVHPIWSSRPIHVRVEAITVRLSLYFAREEQWWWTASMKQAGKRADILGTLSQTMGAHVGKGTLRQL
jgi:hypothetical protein